MRKLFISVLIFITLLSTLFQTKAQDLGSRGSKSDLSQDSFKLSSATTKPIVISPELNISGRTGLSTISTQIIIQTGESIDGTNPVISLGSGPSINNYGKIAFTALNESDNARTVCLYDNGNYVRKYYTPANLPGVAVQVNDLDHIAYWAQFHIDPDLNTYIFRLDNENSGPMIASGNPWLDRWETEFNSLSAFVSIANNDRVIFGGDLRIGGTVLASRTSGSDEYQMSPKLSNFPTFFPMISDDNRTIIRGGVSETAPIMLFLDETLSSENSIGLANYPEFTRMGDKPGISDDGRVSVFMAQHSSEGSGIYVTTVNNSGRAVQFKLTSLPGEQVNLNHRVAVNKAGSVSQFEYLVVYLANDSEGNLTLYTNKIDVSNPYEPDVLSTSEISKVGESIFGLNGNIKHLNIYDPVNNFGEIIFWVETDANNQAIILAKIPDENPGEIKLISAKCTESDKQIVPADLIKIELTFENSYDKPVDQLEIQLTSDLFREKEFFFSATNQGTGRFTHTITANIVSEDEDILAGLMINDDQIPIKDYFSINISYIIENQVNSKTLPVILINEKGEEWSVTYPDFEKVTFKPKEATNDELEFYRKGDSGITDPEDPQFREYSIRVRKYAIKAARYKGTTVFKEEEKRQRNCFDRPLDPENWFGVFPDDAKEVVDAIRVYVDDLIDPDDAPMGEAVHWPIEILKWTEEGIVNLDIGRNETYPDLCKDCEKYEWGYELKNYYPVQERKNRNIQGHVCIEHTILFTSLVRNLGFYVREVNVKLAKTIYNRLSSAGYQEAAAEVWIDGVWSFYDVYLWVNSFDDYATLGYEYAIAGYAYKDEGSKRDWTTIGLLLWNGSHFLTPSHWREIDNKQQKEVVNIVTSSQTHLLLTNNNGSRVGATGIIVTDDLMDLGDSPNIHRPNVINEISDAVYIPQGTLGYSNSNDINSVYSFDQVIEIPSVELAKSVSVKKLNPNTFIETSDESSAVLEVFGNSNETYDLLLFRFDTYNDSIITSISGRIDSGQVETFLISYPNTPGTPLTIKKAKSDTLYVPSQYPNIATAMDYAFPGDFIKVSPGIYNESIEMKEYVTLLGSGFDTTIIDGLGQGNKNGSVILAAEGSVIEGFTIRNADTLALSKLGAGIDARNTNVIIRNNWITKCQTGIYCQGRTTIERNVLVDNIYQGGIYCDSLSAPFIRNNTISRNGIGLFVAFNSSPKVVNNIFSENSTGIFYNNAISDSVIYNDVFNNGINYAAIENQSGINGNISKNPEFEDSENQKFQLKETSPCIDVGQLSAPKDPDGTRSDMGAFFYDQSITNVSYNTNSIRKDYFLYQNYPNPFNPSTIISFNIPTASFVSLIVYNANGQIITTLVNEYKSTGVYSVRWDAGKNSSGFYYYKITAGDYTEVKKSILLK